MYVVYMGGVNSTAQHDLHELHDLNDLHDLHDLN